MENRQNEAANALPDKKELKHQLTDKIEAALPELRELLGDKKFASRIKKAAKLLMEGMYKHHASKNSAAKKEKQPRKAAVKKSTKRATFKKRTAKAAPKKAKAAAVRKTKAAAKKSAGK